jgi:chromosome segregation ATPase
MTSSSGSVLEQLLTLERKTSAALTEQTTILSQQMEAKEALVRQLGEQVACLQTQRQGDQHDLTEARHEIDVLKTKLSALEPQVYSVEAVKDKKRTLKRCLTEANEEVLPRLSCIACAVACSSAEGLLCDKHCVQMARLKREVSTSQQEVIGSWRQKCDELAGEASMLRANLQEAEAVKAETERSLAQLRVENDSLVGSVDRLERLNQDLVSANRVLEEKVSSLTVALESSGTSLASVAADSGSSTLVSDEELQRLRLALDDATSQLASTQASLIALKQTSEEGVRGCVFMRNTSLLFASFARCRSRSLRKPVRK